MTPPVVAQVFAAEVPLAFGHLVTSQHLVRNNGALDRAIR